MLTVIEKKIIKAYKSPFMGSLTGLKKFLITSLKVYAINICLLNIMMPQRKKKPIFNSLLENSNFR